MSWRTASGLEKKAQSHIVKIFDEWKCNQHNPHPDLRMALESTKPNLPQRSSGMNQIIVSPNSCLIKPIGVEESKNKVTKPSTQ